MPSTFTIRQATSEDTDSILRIYYQGIGDRCAYKGVADLSIYIERRYRGIGAGSLLLEQLHQAAKRNDFYKIVLFTFPFNHRGQGLY